MGNACCRCFMCVCLSLEHLMLMYLTTKRRSFAHLVMNGYVLVSTNIIDTDFRIRHNRTKPGFWVWLGLNKPVTPSRSSSHGVGYLD